MIHVFVTHLTARIDYAFRLVFETILNDKVKFYQDTVAFQQQKGVSINYSVDSTVPGLFLRPHGLLQESHVQIQYPDMLEWKGHKALFAVDDSFIPFDLFAASFYLVVRYEEYITTEKDSHQRFMSCNSIACKNNFLEKPLVNHWALTLADCIESSVSGFRFKRSTFTYLPTIDVDNAWAFKHKGLFRSLMASCRNVLNLKWDVVVVRIKVLMGVKKDPYDNYGYLFSIFKKYNFLSRFFILINNRGRFDRSISYKNKYYHQLISELNNKSTVGIHPSYASNESEKILSNEIDRLHLIVGEEIIHSRQHFLRLNFPSTYQKLISRGIQCDYSMGYADKSGFRASIATPFLFFDLLKNQSTTLCIYPFQVMDATLLHYQSLRVDQAIEKIKKLMDETHEVGGTFVSLWHNESLSEEGVWIGWREVYEQMTQHAFQLQLRD